MNKPNSLISVFPFVLYAESAREIVRKRLELKRKCIIWFFTTGSSSKPLQIFITVIRDSHKKNQPNFFVQNITEE